MSGQGRMGPGHRFVDLVDVDGNLSGQAGQVVVVNEAETGLEFGAQTPAAAGFSGSFDTATHTVTVVNGLITAVEELP